MNKREIRTLAEMEYFNKVMISRKELSEKLDVSIRTVDRYREKGMPYAKFAGSIKFDLKEVLEWLKEI